MTTIPEIADYEVRRELLRAKKTASVSRLDALADVMEYLPISTAAMRKASELWASARQIGQPTAATQRIFADLVSVARKMIRPRETRRQRIQWRHGYILCCRKRRMLPFD